MTELRLATPTLSRTDAENYAEWFSLLADPTRVRLLHTLATSPAGAMRIGDLAESLAISQSTCSHHVEMLKKVGFVVVDKVGTSSMVSVNPACCTGLPHAADVVMGTLSSPPCCPEDLPADVTTRPVTEEDMPTVLAIYEEGLATDSDIAMAKLKATEMLAMVADEAIQIHGGMGLMDELPLERIWRDARIERIWDGTSEIQRHIISRAMLRPLGA